LARSSVHWDSRARYLIAISAGSMLRGNRLGSALIYRHRKTVAFITQQVQQFLISAMDRRPAHLPLHAVPQPIQLLPGHWLSFAFSRAALSRNLIPTISSECEVRHNQAPRRSFDVSMLRFGVFAPASVFSRSFDEALHSLI
jgi:hypothetical protein